MTRLLLLALLVTAAGAEARVDLEPYVGLYLGSFESALTPDPDDDLNYNPCNPDTRDCSVHQDPLLDVLLDLSLDSKGDLVAAFYRSETQLKSERPLDLLGRGCGASLGAMEQLSGAEKDSGVRWTARFDLSVENRACLGRLRPTSEHFVVLRALADPESEAPLIEVAIDKAVVSRNYLYVKENGVDRRVRLDLDNTRGSGRRAQYRVCIEDDLGEFSRCVVTDKTLKQFALPVPLPGGVAVNYTWWYDLSPNLKRTRDLYELTQYTARFSRIR